MGGATAVAGTVGFGLDPAARISVMRLFADLAAKGRGVIASLHDLGLAARHCTRLVVPDQGRIAADGPPGAVLTPDLLARVFGITAHLSHGPDGLIFQPLSLTWSARSETCPRPRIQTADPGHVLHRERHEPARAARHAGDADPQDRAPMGGDAPQFWMASAPAASSAAKTKRA